MKILGLMALAGVLGIYPVFPLPKRFKSPWRGTRVRLRMWEDIFFTMVMPAGTIPTVSMLAIRPNIP